MSLVSYLWRINWVQAASTAEAVAPILSDPSETTPKGLHAEHWLVLLKTLHFNMISGIIGFFHVFSGEYMIKIIPEGRCIFSSIEDDSVFYVLLPKQEDLSLHPQNQCKIGAVVAHICVI